MDWTDGLISCPQRHQGELLDAVPEDIHYVDFNQAGKLFEPTDFMDTDHLSEKGAEKVSHILSELFGK